MFHLLHHLISGPSCYALCAVARSGAHLLSAGLRATGMAGRPLQYFHELLSLKYGARYGLDATHQFAEYVTGIVSATATRNRVFGFRLEACDLDRVVSQLRETRAFGSSTASEIQVLRSAFPRLRCIQLTRRDKLRQAISKARAIQTNRWVAGKEGHRNREPVFDPELINHCLISAEISEKIWNRFFQRNEIEPLAITYEELCTDYRGTLAHALDFLHLRPARDFVLGPPQTERQADALTEEWLERYAQLVAEKGGTYQAAGP